MRIARSCSRLLSHQARSNRPSWPRRNPPFRVRSWLAWPPRAPLPSSCTPPTRPSRGRPRRAPRRAPRCAPRRTSPARGGGPARSHRSPRGCGQNISVLKDWERKTLGQKAAGPEKIWKGKPAPRVQTLITSMQNTPRIPSARFARRSFGDSLTGHTPESCPVRLARRIPWARARIK